MMPLCLLTGAIREVVFHIEFAKFTLVVNQCIEFVNHIPGAGGGGEPHKTNK